MKNQKEFVLPKYAGFEMEFGNHQAAAGRTGEELVGPAAHLAQAHTELFGCGRLAIDGCGRGLGEFGVHQFRVYDDHGHLEISAPLARSAADMVLWQRRALKLARCCQKYATKRQGQVSVHCANTNRNGVAWGYHINVLVSRQIFDQWRDKEWGPLMKQWIPFLVTSPIMFGTGKIGTENNKAPASFQLSQRADFIDRICGLETVASKSLINFRDEALADPGRYARFHIAAAFDFNCSEFSSWLKFGTCQLLLALIESGAKLPNLELDDPLGAVATVSRDLTLSTSLKLDKRRRMTALEIQHELACAAEQAVCKGIISNNIVSGAIDIARRWRETLEQLQRNDGKLYRRLDWLIKLRALEECRDRLGTDWDDPRLTVFDLRYAELGTGWYELLEQGHMVDRLEDFVSDENGDSEPQSSDRDRARAHILEKFRRNIAAADWHRVCLAVAEKGRSVIYRVNLDDPLDAEKVGRAVKHSANVKQFIKSLGQNDCVRANCSTADNFAAQQLA